MILNEKSFAQPFDKVEQIYANLSSQADKLNYLQSLSEEVSEASEDYQSRYWFLLATSYEKNNALEESKAAFTKVLEILADSNSNPELYIKTLIERSYISYLQTYAEEDYCPDRKLAYETLDHTISVDLQVRALVQYSFCFKNKKDKFDVGLQLLDQALALANEHHLAPRTHAMIYNASGIIYGTNYLYTQAKEYLINAYKQWESVEDYQDMFNMLHSINNVAINSFDYSLGQQQVDAMYALSESHPEFKDFLFFSYFNDGLLALAKEEFERSHSLLVKALEQQEHTEEKFFVRLTYEHLIALNFKIGKLERANEYLNTLIAQFPGHEIQSNSIKAMQAFNIGDYMQASRYFFSEIDKQVRQRRVANSEAIKATAIVNAKNIAELDKQLLKKQLEVKELALAAQEAEQKSTKLLLTVFFILVVGLLGFIYYLFRTRQYFKFHARVDHLTGVFNRRFTLKRGKELFEKAKAQNFPMSVLLFDIDNFKTINDSKGHYVGDLAIKFIVANTQSCLPNSAIFGRLGGDEFLVVLPKISSRDAIELAELIRAKIENSVLVEAEGLPITTSIGCVDTSDFEDLQATIIAADDMLYTAKEQGRNLVVVNSRDK